MYKILLLFIASVITIIVAGNIFSSQLTDSTFYGVTNENRDDVLSFLNKINNKRVYLKQVNYFSNLFGSDFKKQVYIDYENRNIKINAIKQYLTINPQSRDLLLTLAIFYYQNEEYGLAKKYYSLAKKIDPWLSIKRIENL